MRDAATTFFHQSCTCRMGRDEGAVVDSQLRVRGIDRLRIADGSIMPRVTTGNTMMPCVIIGERMRRDPDGVNRRTSDGFAHPRPRPVAEWDRHPRPVRRGQHASVVLLGPDCVRFCRGAGRLTNINAFSAHC